MAVIIVRAYPSHRNPPRPNFACGIFRWWITTGSVHAGMTEAVENFKAFGRGDIDHLPGLPGITDFSAKGVVSWR